MRYSKGKLNPIRLKIFFHFPVTKMGNTQTIEEKPKRGTILDLVAVQPSPQQIPKPQQSPVVQPDPKTTSYCQWLRQFDEDVKFEEEYHCLPIKWIAEEIGESILDIPEIPTYNPLKEGVWNEKIRRDFIKNVCNKLKCVDKRD